MMLYKFIPVLLLFLISAPAVGQDTVTLNHREFLAIVKQYHPLAFRYNLQNEIASLGVQAARGNFDPIASAKTGSKSIDNTFYYDEQLAELEIPTWYGITVNGQYRTIEGDKLNNSETVGGLYTAGVTIPIAKNLLYDQRRAVLEQAKLGVTMTQAEQQVLTNKLLLDADNAYWEWVRNFELLQLQKRMAENSWQRLDYIRKTFNYGERASIDTVEALSQYQNFQLQVEAAQLDFLKVTQELSVFLWEENRMPYDIQAPIIPGEKFVTTTAEFTDIKTFPLIDSQSITDHANLRYYFQKQKILESERRLKFQSLLPKLDFTYNFFNKQGYNANYFPLFADNYLYAVKLEVPLFLREARANYRIAKNKIQQNEMDTKFKEQEIRAKIQVLKNEFAIYTRQIELVNNNITLYRRLLNAEETLFRNGESSLFIINTRENKLMENEQKLLELKLKVRYSYNGLKWTQENFSIPN